MSNSYKSSKVPTKLITDHIDTYISYQPQDIGFSKIDGNGRDVSICIIDSGYPDHDSIQVASGHSVDFTLKGTTSKDLNGHGTAVAGLIKSNGMITGLAPMSSVFYAKALDDRGVGSHGAVQAAVLYAIIRKVDIIVMSFGSESSHPVLHDAIRKAHSSNIAIFAAAGNITSKTKDAEYPARFPEVMSIGICSGGKPKICEYGSYTMEFAARSFQTLYAADRYVNVGGSSMMTAFCAGVGARIVQKMRQSGEQVSPTKVYEQMMSLFPSS